MRKLVRFLFFLVFFSCARQEDPVVAQIKLRKMQSRTYVGQDARSLSKQVIQVLQDGGYMVKNVSTDIGLITAELNTNVEKLSSKFWAIVFSGRRARWQKRSVIEMTANISEEIKQSQIRINYQIKVFDNLGRIVDVHQVLDDEIYVDFFNRIQMGLFGKEAPKN